MSSGGSFTVIKNTYLCILVLSSMMYMSNDIDVMKLLCNTCLLIIVLMLNLETFSAFAARHNNSLSMDVHPTINWEMSHIALHHC